MQLVAHGLAEAVQRVGLVTTHVRPVRMSASRTASDSRVEHGALAREGVAAFVALAHRHAHDVLLLDAVGQPVQRHVQARPEEVLVVRRAEPGRQFGGVGVPLAGVGAGENDAGGLGLELDGAVQVEVPVEAVVVIADGGEERDDQPPVAARVVDSGPQVRVLGEDGPVLLVHADAVADLARVAERVADDRAQVRDFAEAVAAQLQRIGVLAHAGILRCRSSFARTAPGRGRRRGRPFRRSTPG